MGGLLHQARKFFRGISTPAPAARVQRFSVACSEGHRQSGARTAGYQALRCPTCGEGLFILPRSPLPAPAEPARESEPPRPRATATTHDLDDAPVPLRDPSPYGTEPEPGAEAGPADGEIEWADEPGQSPEDLAADEIAAATAATATHPDRPPARPRRARPGAPAPAAEPDAGAGGEAGPVAPHVPVVERLRRYRNPLIFLGVALVVAATVGLRVWRAHRAELPVIAERGRVEGLAALDAGQFDKANQILAEAKRAVVGLGGAYRGAAAIVQGADEAAIIAGLGTSRLEDLIDEATRTEPKEWARRFDTFYKGRSYIFDAHVSAVPGPTGEGAYELDYRVFREGEGTDPPSVGRVDLTGLRLFELQRPRLHQPIRFGARLASFHFDPDAGPRGEWVVGLEPDSGVVMTHQKALEALGWPSAPLDAEGEDRP